MPQEETPRPSRPGTGHVDPYGTNPGGTPAAPGPSLPNPFPGEFRVVEVLGEGSFGTVRLAEDMDLGRPVALKTLRSPGSPSAPALAALQHEARLLAGLRHPHIVQVYAWRQAGGEHYLVEQYVPGGSLGARLRREGPFPWQEAARYVADVGEGLVEVHARGIVHRDVKPDNVLWDRDWDEALLTDFGISARLAGTGGVAGTPLYMAPEAFEGRLLPAMDVVSLAATLFHLVTGTPPFAAASLPDLCAQIAAGLPDPDPRCRGLPEPLEQVVRAGLAVDPEGRPGLKDFLTRLRGTLNQLLADTLPPSPDAGSGSVPATLGLPAAGPAGLRLVVSREEAGGVCRQVAATRAKPAEQTRDIRRVPRPPGQVVLRTGDRIRIEVVADRDGSVAVFNVGPSGNLTLLYPDDPSSASAAARGGQPLHVLDAELTPPTGRERLFALWTRRPLPLRPEELRALAEQDGAGASGPHAATRDIKRLRQSVRQLPPEDWQVAVLELEHTEGEPR